MRNSYNNDQRPNWQHNLDRRHASDLPQDLPPLGRWTKQWRDFPCDQEKFVGFALDAMKANVAMYERHVASDPENEIFAAWLTRSRDDLEKLELWLEQRRADIAQHEFMTGL